MFLLRLLLMDRVVSLIRNPYMFLMTIRYSESLFIGTFVYGRIIRITDYKSQIEIIL